MSEALLKKWNEILTVGTSVKYFPVKGRPEFVESKIRSQVWQLGSGSLVVSIEGKAGGVDVHHLEVVG